MRLVVDDRAGALPRLVRRHLLAAHAHPHLASGHGDDGDAPADAAPRHRPLAPRRPHEHRGRHGLDAHVPDHRLQQAHVADRAQRLLLPHEQRRGRRPRRPVGLLVAAALHARHALEEALPAGELARVGGEPGEEAVGALVPALGLGAARPAGHEPAPGLAHEPLDALGPAPPAALDGDGGGHVVGCQLLGCPAQRPERRQQARQQVVGRPRPRRDEHVPARVAERRGEHAELVDLALRVDEPHPLLPVELQLPARRRLEPRVRLGGGGAPEGYALAPAPRGERPVAGQRRVAAPVGQQLVDGALGHPGQLGLRLDHRPHALEVMWQHLFGQIYERIRPASLNPTGVM